MRNPHPYATLLNALVDMQQSPLYAARRSILEQAELLIVNLSAKLATAPPAWQPIETAPKDGTVVLLMKRGNKVPNRIANGEWRETSSLKKPGFWVWAYLFFEPTHWMPLPAPPKDAT